MHTLILTYPTPMEDDASLAGKFLQLRLAARDYILFATATECRYHNQILARFLSEQGIPVWCKYSNEPYDIVIRQYCG
jgi:hypothetical protein